MNRINWEELSAITQRALKKHAPEVLTGVGIAGMITTTFLAVRATPEAARRIEQKKKEENTDRLGLVQTVKVAGVYYIPAAVTGTLSIGCLIGASSVSGRRNAALATAYQLSESALKTYREKVVEVVGEKKEEQVRDAVAKEHIQRHPVVTNEVYVTGSGHTLCFDVPSGRYFKSDIELIRRARNEINRRMMTEMYISLNDFYYEIGLPPIGLGNELGWEINKGFLEINFRSQLTDGNIPCLVIEYHPIPEYKYH